MHINGLDLSKEDLLYKNKEGKYRGLKDLYVQHVFPLMLKEKAILFLRRHVICVLCSSVRAIKWDKKLKLFTTINLLTSFYLPNGNSGWCLISTSLAIV